jgi:hydrogenase maturation protease
MIVIGVGNEFRHDDGVGLIAARRLREEGVAAEELHLDVAMLMERWNGAEGVILLDAVSSGAAAGTIHHVDVSVSRAPAKFFSSSTHGIGLPEAIEISRLFGTLPRQLLIIGVEGEDFSTGVGLSVAVKAALPGLIAQVRYLF